MGSSWNSGMCHTSLIMAAITDAVSYPNAMQFSPRIPNRVKDLSVRPAVFSPVASSSWPGRNKSTPSTALVRLFWYLTTAAYNLELVVAASDRNRKWLACKSTNYIRLNCLLIICWYRRSCLSMGRQYISDLHSKVAVWPHHVYKYGRHPVYDLWD